MPYKNPKDIKKNRIKWDKLNPNYSKQYYLKNKEKRNEYSRTYRKKHPCWTILKNIQARCDYQNSKYYKKGIKNFLSLQDIEFLWKRDRAYLLEWPSIDRINGLEDYTLDNCRFIEFRENCRLGVIKRWKNLQNSETDFII